MLPPVLQNVDECMTDVARGRQVTTMVSIVPYLPAAAEHAIDRLGDANRQPLDATAQRGHSVALEDQMDVIALHTELNESKLVGGCSRECRTDRREEAVLSERRKMRARPERNMDRTAAIVRGAATVRQASAPRRWLSPSAIAAAAPGRRGRKAQLSRPARHLEWADIIASLLLCQATRQPRIRDAGRLVARRDGP